MDAAGPDHLICPGRAGPLICLGRAGDACVVGALERVGDTLYGARVYVKLGRRLAHAHAVKQVDAERVTPPDACSSSSPMKARASQGPTDSRIFGGTDDGGTGIHRAARKILPFEEDDAPYRRDHSPAGGRILRGMRSLGPTAVSASSISRFLGLGACALAAAGAKSKPRKVSFASAGVGSGSHMAGELFKMMAGVDIVHVPYRGGGPALTDLLGGQVQLMFPGTIAAIEYIKAGTLRPLAVTTATRAEVLPNLPTVSDFVPGYESSLVDGIGAPKNTPLEIIEKLNREINAGLAPPKLRQHLADFGGTVLPGSPADYGRLIVAETNKWAKVIKFAGLKAS